MNILDNQKYKKLFLATALIAALGLSGCNDDDNDDVVDTQSSFVSQKAYTASDIPEFAKSIDVMTYKMPYVTGKMENATAMVMMPKTAKPADGWRVVVWTHGTVGVGDTCAPSGNALGENFSILAESLLERGYIVVAPDYEGLGTPGIHPYLNLQSASQSAIHAIKAVKEKFGTDLNGSWMSVGQSQGGHASLGIAQYAASDETYKGAVATAPASSLGYIITQIAPQAIANLEQNVSPQVAIGVYAELLSYAAYTAVGIKAYKPDFDYKIMFQPRALALATNAEGTTGDNGLCLSDIRNTFAADIMKFLAEDMTRKVMDYPAFVKNFENDPVILDFLKTSQPATEKFVKPVYVVQGKLDAAVPYQVTQALVDNVNKLGSTPQVKIDVVEGAGHTEAIVQKNESVVGFIQENMPES